MTVSLHYPGVYLQEPGSVADPVFEPSLEAAADLAKAIHFAVRFGEGEPVTFAEVGGLTPGPMSVRLTIADGSEVSAPVPAPTPSTASHVLLKGGVLPVASAILAWCKQVVGAPLDASLATRDVKVTLVGPHGLALRTWRLGAAWPVKVMGDLDANPAWIETLELVCESVTASGGETAASTDAPPARSPPSAHLTHRRRSEHPLAGGSVTGGQVPQPMGVLD